MSECGERLKFSYIFNSIETGKSDYTLELDHPSRSTTLNNGQWGICFVDFNHKFNIELINYRRLKTYFMA